MKDRGGDALDHDPEMIGRGAAEGNANLVEVGDGRGSEQAPRARAVRASSPRPWLALWIVALAGTIAVALSGRPLAGAAPAPSPTVTASATAAASFPAGALPGWAGGAASLDPWFGDLRLRVADLRAVRGRAGTPRDLTLTAEIEAAREHRGELRWRLAGLVARPYAVGGSTVPLVAAPTSPLPRGRAAQPTLWPGANTFILRADHRQLRWLVTEGRTLWLVLEVDEGERSALLAVPVELTVAR